MPALSDILDNIADLIETIKIENGWSYDFGSINVTDEAKMKYPSADITFLGENPVDVNTGSNFGVFVTDINITLRCPILANAQDKPNRLHEYDNYLSDRLQDIKKVLLTANGGYLSLVDDNAVIKYMGCEKVTDKNNDVYRPAHLLTKWQVTYQDYGTELTE